ncbi:DUF885 domain-containing protein [Nocardia brasiliensis]|uniref:DUF885 domain-containing protein n=1 Tax=Nocardia brasiliensis TaxID=37326 RepID=UPI0033C2ACA0
MSGAESERPAYEPVVREYLLLGLRLGRLIDGFVDCWFGDPRLAARVADESPAAPADLARQAARLRAELADSGLSDSRQRYLSAQLTALECVGKRLSGTDISFRDEIRQYFDVEIALGDPACYADAHEAIAELLPGTGGVQERLDAYYERNRVPPDRLQQAAQAVSDELRGLARPLFGLPAGERVDYEVVHGKPWNAFNRYLGGFRSKVALNDEAGRAIAALPILVTHESYPGHHTEHCLKEAGLVREHGHGEQLIALVNTPQCLLSEGTAELAHVAVLGAGWGEWTAQILAAEGIFSDGELVERVRAQLQRLFAARQDAAIMLHDRGATVDEVTDYLERWLLLPRDRAQHMVRFLTDPLWRAYTVTYIEGARLVGAWLAAGPTDQPVAERYLRLLREPLLPCDLQRDLDATKAKPAIRH